MEVFFVIEEVKYGEKKVEDISQTLTDVLNLESSYQKSEVTLKIDLIEMSPLFTGSTVSGYLKFMTNF